MPSEGVQRQLDRLLQQADTAIERLGLREVRDRAKGRELNLQPLCVAVLDAGATSRP